MNIMEKKFRNYENDVIKNLYYKMRKNQTIEYVNNMKKKYLTYDTPMKIWDAAMELKNFKDLSDPDLDLANINHLFQTAEAIRKDGHPDWFQLVGFIHDLGKIMFKKGCDEDGTSLKEQWGIVGDTYILGCRIPNNIVYSEFNESNEETELGIYKENCGLDKCIITWGHDEYLYQILKNSDCTIPEIGLKVIRYHSLYPWHKEDNYEKLENDKDKAVKKWVKLFNGYDLYSKENTEISNEKLEIYYKNLINKYFKKDIIYI